MCDRVHVGIERRKKGRRSGITLVEVALAMVVLMIGFSGILGVTTHVLRMVRMAREQTWAVNAAQQVLETVKTYSWVRLGMMSGEHTFDISGNPIFADLPESACAVTVLEVPGGTGGLRLVSARVRWRQANGTEAEQELASLVARRHRLL